MFWAARIIIMGSLFRPLVNSRALSVKMRVIYLKGEKINTP